MAELVLTFELFPGRTLTLALFRDVTNAKWEDVLTST